MVERVAVWLLLGACACGPKVDEPGGGGGGTDTEGDGNDDGDDADGDDADVGDGDGDGDDGDGDGDGAYVDCSALPVGGPTVGGGDVGPLGFPAAPCNPRLAGEGSNDEYLCCSDDPAAVGGALPAYQGKDIDGDTPYFADANNEIGTWGLCVRTSDIPPGSGLVSDAATNCPVPCNPTWNADEVAQVCGSSRICCQTIELQPEDCVVDPATGEFRPVTGHDIGEQGADGQIITDWAPNSHATHQDPSGPGCMSLTSGDADAFEDCVRQLTVANQRGYCMALGPGQQCPHTAASYVDACEQLNGR